MKLRDYQSETVSEIQYFFSSGKSRCLIYLSTGAGKSAIFREIIKRSLLKGKRVLFVVRRRQIVHQVVRDFNSAGFLCSVMMGSGSTDRSKKLLVCSIDTAIKRDFKFEKFDLAIVDEAHDATSGAYREFLDNLDCKFFVGFTATPFRVGKHGHTFWDSVSHKIDMTGLVERGYLTDAKLFGPPAKAELDKIKISAGEYNQRQLGDEMSKLKVVADVVQTYKQLGQNKAAICFCVNKKHSETLASQFNMAGIPAIHADCDSSKEERENAISLLKSGKIKVICNVNIWSTGVDIPCVEVCILARPTKSINLYLQQVGRAFRPYRVCGSCHESYDNSLQCYHCGEANPRYIKQYAIVLDHGENIKRHGQPHIARQPELDDAKKGEVTRDVPELKICKNCAFVIDSLTEEACPSCGEFLSKGKKAGTVTQSEGKLVQYDKVKPLTDEQIKELFRRRFSRQKI